jgi:histidinol phosphatase-like enzyme (inositol monophosphatase family)
MREIPGSGQFAYFERPLTAADNESEAAIRRMIERDYPDHGIVGEEYGPHKMDAEYVWVIDPVDGTRAFICGKPIFGTLVALLHKGVPIIGVINQPILRERWVGAQGRPTTMNGMRISTRKISQLREVIMGTTSPEMFKTEEDYSAFNRLRRSVRMTNYGGDCYSYGLLAMGFIDVIVEAGLHIYDYAALVPVVEGAGGLMTDWDGYPLQDKIGQRILRMELGERVHVLATGDQNVHDQAIAKLKGIGDIA